LFLLVAGLDSPDIFAEPLFDVYRRLRRRSETMDVNEKDCLLAALTRNQKDLRLYEMWRQMIETGRHDILPGNEFAGFEGFKWLPPRPNFRMIAWGVKLMEPARPTLEAVYRLAGLMGAVVTELAPSNGLIGLLDGGVDAGWDDALIAAWSSVAVVHHKHLDKFLNQSPVAEARAVADIAAKGLWYYQKLLHTGSPETVKRIPEVAAVRSRVLEWRAKAA
jgi:hypothetical protein